MRAFGASAAQIERMEQTLQERKASQATDEQAGHFGVWADNWPAVMAWCGVDTQWRTAGMAGVMTGLDYAGVNAWLQIFVKRGERKEIMQAIQVMEHAALAAMAELREQEKGE